ncbi:MAG: DUF4238 domain-containing protein [Pseudomonadota bacterium]
MNVRRQHYVPQAYLSAWTVSGSLFCLRDGKVFAASTRDVGQQRDFYRLRDLTDEDIAIVEMMIRRLPEHVQTDAHGLLERFARVPRLRKHVEAIGSAGAEALKELDLLANSMEEEMHGLVESSGLPFVKRMLDCDTSFLADSKAAPAFLHFLSLQNFRTKRVRERVLGMQRDSGIPITFERSWNVLCHILATSTTWSLYNDRHKLRLVLLDNATGVPLMTGDQPLINLLSGGDWPPPEKLAWYYPLSPARAMVLTEPPYIYASERVQLSVDDVHRLNGRIHSASHEQLYSVSREQLEAMQRT